MKESDTQIGAEEAAATGTAKEEKVDGLAELEGIRKNWTLRSLIIIWIAAFLMSFVNNLNNHSSSTFIPFATSDFGSAPLLGTIGVVQATIASVTLQPLARFADVYGRLEMFLFCVVMATLGNIMAASSQSISVYAGSQVFFVLGLQGITLMLQILAGDSSDIYNRALVNSIPYASSIITAWSSGPFATSILVHSWRWGFGVFAILIPVTAIPMLGCLYYSKAKAAKQRKAEGTYRRKNYLKNFPRLDPVGLILFATGLSLLLVPFSLAASSSDRWKETQNIIMLVIGPVSLVAFVVWEIWGAKWPTLPFHLLRTRTIIFGVAASIIDYAALYLLQNFLITYELVAADLSTTTAAYIFAIIPFMGPIGQISAGFMVKYLKRYKWILVSGYALNILGLGLSYRYINAHDHMAALVISQMILGFGSGVINTMQFGMQASVSHSNMAAVTALFTASLGVGSAIGGAVGGGVWTELVPQNLARNLPEEAQSQLPAIFGSVVVATSFEWGTPVRDAINKSFHDAFRAMLKIALILQAFAFIAGLIVQDLNLKEVEEAREYDGIVIGKTGAVDAVKSKVCGEARVKQGVDRV
ncbi:major facilitator superfamily domain-containing protein [Aspergillus pseudoustus]|uniref:Major facilitator superfamily domain-containing protein n=1 Tax=Aspergillus pseudoustus TaxID=1810923 RepID=A0ABR4KVY9_9EURO